MCRSQGKKWQRVQLAVDSLVRCHQELLLRAELLRSMCNSSSNVRSSICFSLPLLTTEERPAARQR